LSDVGFAMALLEIVWVNLLLSGDNALVIGLASRSLPVPLQKWGVILGVVPAVFLRIVFTGVVSYLITIPFLKIAGGGLLVSIAYGLLRGEQCAIDGKRMKPTTMWAAAWTIIVADTVMSLDNVIAIAAAARGNMALLVIGLVISMPMVICGAGILIRLLNRFPVLIVPSASLLGYIAGELIVSDVWLADWIGSPDALVGVVVPAVIALLLAGAGLATRPAVPQELPPGSLSQRDAA
jgi:YjbE family integral membrane protein